jgi:REP element-mobilizing transposase RayT
MKLFRSKEQNLVHYVTAVTYQRVPVFKSDEACMLFIEALAETRLKDRFRLIGYVVMPDHFHLLANPVGLNITTVVGKLKGRSASKILKRLRTEVQTENPSSIKASACLGFWSNSCPLASGLLVNRHLESQVYPPEARLYSFKSGSRGVVRSSRQVAMVKLPCLLAS